MNGIKLKVMPKFPASVYAQSGVAVHVAGGSFTFSLDYTKFNILGALPVNPNLYVLAWDSLLNQYELVPPAGGLTEAPLDAFTYGRHGGGWSKALDLANGGTVTGNVTFNGTATFGSTATFSGTVSFSGTTTIASPSLTGTPTAPTPTAGDSSTKIATTAFVNNNIPATLGGTSGAWGTSNATIINASGTFTLTLPSASANAGREMLLKSITAQIVNSASANVCPIASATPGTAIFTATAGKWATLISDGTNWIIMEGN